MLTILYYVVNYLSGIIYRELHPLNEQCHEMLVEMKQQLHSRTHFSVKKSAFSKLVRPKNRVCSLFSLETESWQNSNFYKNPRFTYTSMDSLLYGR
jgi:hypothetical protein